MSFLILFLPYQYILLFSSVGFFIYQSLSQNSLAWLRVESGKSSRSGSEHAFFSHACGVTRPVWHGIMGSESQGGPGVLQPNFLMTFFSHFPKHLSTQILLIIHPLFIQPNKNYFYLPSHKFPIYSL